MKPHDHAGRVVLVHGRAAAMDVPATFEAEWVAAARWGLSRIGYAHASCVPITMPFFGKFWRPDEHTTTPVFDPGRSGAEVVATPEGLPDFGRAIEAIGEWIDGRIGGSGVILKYLLNDTKEYFERSDLRRETDKEVADACIGSGEVVLVGFSMGSLVAYNVLAHAEAAFPVRSLITCGSPMGDRSFREHLAKIAPHGKLRFPSVLRMWVNIWNDDDPATQVYDLTPFFPGDHVVQTAPTRGRGPSPINPAAAHNGPDYLGSKALAAAVRTALDAAEGSRS